MTSTFWPVDHTDAGCTMPSEMIRACQSFEHFYLSRHSGRRLKWKPNVGNADVRVEFKTRKHDINVSTYALVILLQFEELEDGMEVTYQVRKKTEKRPHLAYVSLNRT
jgi:cullin 3